MLEQKPIRGKSYGRPTQPDSRNRFAQWLVWKQEQRNRRALLSRRTYQLFNAHEVHAVLPRGAKRVTERTIRPLDWFRKQKLQRFIPDVWARAVELAGTADAVTSAHTRQAVNVLPVWFCCPQRVRNIPERCQRFSYTLNAYTQVRPTMPTRLNVTGRRGAPIRPTGQLIR